MQLIEVEFSVYATVEVSIVIDEETYEGLSSEELGKLAIAKAKRSEIEWECRKSEATKFNSDSK